MSTGSRLLRVVLELCLFIKKSVLNTDAKASLATELKARAREQLSPEHRKKSRISPGSLICPSSSPKWTTPTPPSKGDVAALYGMPSLPIEDSICIDLLSQEDPMRQSRALQGAQRKLRAHLRCLTRTTPALRSMETTCAIWIVAQAL